MPVSEEKRRKERNTDKPKWYESVMDHLRKVVDETCISRKLCTCTDIGS